MALIEWSDQFSVGIKSVDDQHKVIVTYINELNDAMLANKGNDVMGKILESLVNYTKTHFAYEESFFKKHGYAETEAHTKEHKDLTDQVLKFGQDFKAGKATVSADLMKFLKTWLMNHIMKSDKKYTSFLVSKGVK